MRRELGILTPDSTPVSVTVETAPTTMETMSATLVTSFTTVEAMTTFVETVPSMEV